jgi:hypothetical protein
MGSLILILFYLILGKVFTQFPTLQIKFQQLFKTTFAIKWVMGGIFVFEQING